MAGCVDPNVQKLELLVANILDGKCIENGFSQRLQEIIAQCAVKIDIKPGTNSAQSNLQRIRQAKSVFDWKQIKSLLMSCETFEKGHENSSKLREKGNELYKEKDLNKALRAYTLAIAFAPVSSEELAVAYANRSGVLLQMNKPHEAMADVQRSLSKCPQHLKDKFEERARKCNSMLEKLTKESNEQDETLCHAEQLFEINEANPKIPNASSFISINYLLEKGRHLVATEDVSAGCVLLVDEPFVSVLKNLLRWEIDHCHNCSRSMINGVHCEDCVFAMFCSEECRGLACGLNGMHHFEHSYLSILHSANASHRDIQTLRLLSLVGPDALVKLWQTKDKAYFKTVNGEDVSGLDKNGVYNSKSYLPVFHLISHEQEGIFEGGISVGVLNALNALFFKALLKEYSDFFQVSVKGKATSLEDFEDFIASLILKHLEGIKYNAISLSKLTNDHQRSVSFAAAIYPLVSLCNHSCDPNCAPVKQSKYLKTSLISLKPLKKGDELFITYKPLYSNMKTSDRQSFLAENYKFICNCQACEENWGPSTIQSYAGGGHLILEPTTCESCNETAGEKNGKPRQCHECALKYVQRAKEIRKMEEVLFECHDLLEKKDYKKNLEHLPEVLDYFGKNQFQSYFPLYYIAVDLFKRALVHSVSRM